MVIKDFVSVSRYLSFPAVSFLVGIVLIGILVNGEAGLSQEQIGSSIGSPTGLTWELSSSESAPWTADNDGIHLGQVAIGSVHAVETTVTGPGVAGLTLEQSYRIFKISVWIDGVLSGPEGFSSNTRVMVGSGQHKIRWKAVRTNEYYTGVRLLSFKHVRWEPFLPQPLSVASDREGVALTSSGSNPWIGQDSWHHGDGGAAWSGLKVDAPAFGNATADAPLRATFEGPVVLDYWWQAMGSGEATVRIDNGALQYHSFYNSSPNAWTRNRRLFGSGSHVIEWNAEPHARADQRGSFDLVVDQIDLRSVVPLSTALGTPGIEWIASDGMNGQCAPYGVEDSTATHGSSVQMSYGSSISMVSAGDRLLRVRSRGQCPSVFFLQNYLNESSRLQEALSDGWEDWVWVLPSGLGELKLIAGVNTEIDQIEWISPPATVAAALGLAEGSFTMGGSDAWVIAPYRELNAYGVSVEALREHGDSWLDMPVTGPAELSFSWKTENYNQQYALLVDGKEIDFADGYKNARKVQIEIPEGAHMVRWLARAPKVSDYHDVYTDFLGGIKIVPLISGGKALAALDFQHVLSLPENWNPSSTFSRDGKDAFQAPSVDFLDPIRYVENRIRASFSGPGVLSFWWYCGLPDASENPMTASWFLRVSKTSEYLVARHASTTPGWKHEKIWLPQGDWTVLEWEVAGSAAQVALTALDSVEFIPSENATLGDALDAPELVWTNDPEHPWKGLVVSEEMGDLALAPALEAEETARLSTVVTGPGKISFHLEDVGVRSGKIDFLVNGQHRASSLWSSGDRVEFFIPVTSPVTLEWIASGGNYTGYSNGRLGVNNVVWEKSPTRSLAESLDAPATVSWKTSENSPFTGRDNPGAKGETVAFIALLPGEESWLEATVNGPGIFDFWLKIAANMNLSYELWNYWSLTIDGVPVAINGLSWQPQWITGNGPHRIRLTFRHPEESAREWIASAVDEVSWIPLERTSLAQASGLAKNFWLSGSEIRAEGFLNTGRDGSSGILLRSVAGKSTSLVTIVRGPCELSWDSAIHENSSVDILRHSLEVDGVKSLPFYQHSWQRMRLSLPKGYHTVRWISQPRLASDELPLIETPVAFNAQWQLCRMDLKPGVSTLMKTLGNSALFALEAGDTGGKSIISAGQKAWQADPMTSLSFFHPNMSGKISVNWGSPAAFSETWWHTNEEGYGERLSNYQSGWQKHVSSIQPGGFSTWSHWPDYHWGGFSSSLLLAALKFDASAALPLSSAIESPRLVNGGGWAGRVDQLAIIGKDSAWSLLNRSGDKHTVSTTLTGPARVGFWWKNHGVGTLRLNLDGAYLPVAVPTEKWTRIEFDINAGEHLVEWVHAANDATHSSSVGEAWLDGLQIRKKKSSTLARAAADHTDFNLTSDNAGNTGYPWHPVAYRETDGNWTKAVRAVSGLRTLRTQVTGPAIIEFRGRCFEGYSAVSPPTAQRISVAGSSVVIIDGGFTPQILGHFISVEVDGIQSQRINAHPGGNWQKGGVYVPAGTHEVTFRLMTWQTFIFGDTIVDATAENLQGWIDDLRVVSLESHFAQWASDNNLPPEFAGQSADVDGDGSNNFLEYAFGSKPLDATSRPQGLEIGIIFRHWIDPSFGLKIPYIPSHITAKLESSTDLVHWDTEITSLLHIPPTSTWFSDVGHTSSYQVFPFSVRIPGDSSKQQKFYRIAIPRDSSSP